MSQHKTAAMMDASQAENFLRSVEVAEVMYVHLTHARMAGLPFADVAAAITILTGMFLADGYGDRLNQEIAARNMAEAAVHHAGALKGLRDLPPFNG